MQDLYPPPSQRCGLCQNFKQTTLTTRLHKVRTNSSLYSLTKTFRRAWQAGLGLALGSRVRIRVSVKVRANLGFRDKVSFRVMVLIDCPSSALFGEGGIPGWLRRI